MSLWGLLLLAPWSAGAEQLIQIGIAPNASEITVHCKTSCSAVDSEGRGLELSPGSDYVLEAADEGRRVGRIEMYETVRDKNGLSGDFWVGKARYRGVLAVKRNADGTVTAVDELGIEDYLLGVLPHEMDPGWPLESLKAQAVVARTFAYTQLGKYRKSGFDLTSDTRSQVFTGTADPAPAILRAVRETRGEVLGYKGKILPVYYHACCGGHTADAASVWGGASSRPISGVRDRWCKDSP
jgi:stage II sporulation protein D